MRLAAEELPMLPGWLMAPQNLGLLLGCCNHPMVPMRRGSGSQPGAGRERPRAPRARLPAAWARGTAAQRAPAESLLAAAPAQRSREHRGDAHAAPACCWIRSAGGGRTDPQRGRGCSSRGLSSSSAPDPREMLSRSLSSAEGRAQCPRATGSRWEREVGPARGHRRPAEPPWGALPMPSVHPGYHYRGRGGRAEKAQREHGLRELVELWIR